MVRTMARTAENHAYSWMLTYEPTVEQLLTDIPEMLRVYAQSAAIMAADYYNGLAGISSYFAKPDEDMPDEKIVNIAAWVHEGPQRPENRMRVAAHKVVFDAARRTIQVNALAEGVALVRDEMAGSCHGCQARTTVDPKEKTGRSDDVDQFFHPSCEGMLVPVREGVYTPPGHTEEWRTRIAAARRAGNTDADSVAKFLAEN